MTTVTSKMIVRTMKEEKRRATDVTARGTPTNMDGASSPVTFSFCVIDKRTKYETETEEVLRRRRRKRTKRRKG